MQRCFAICTFAAFLVLMLSACQNNSPKNDAKKPKPALIDVWQTTDNASERIALLLRPGDIRAEMLQLAAPPRLNELGTKLKKAAQDNPGPWLQQVFSRKAGQVLPYDKRFGISEAEYKEFIALSDKMTLQVTGHADLTIEVVNNEEYTITGLPELAELRIDAKKMSVTTPYGAISQPAEVKANENQKITGPHNGYSWKTGLGGLLAEKTLRIYLGQFTESKDVMMEIRVKDVDKNRYLADYLVRFPGPSK